MYRSKSPARCIPVFSALIGARPVIWSRNAMSETVRNTVVTAIEKYLDFFLRSFDTYSNAVRRTAVNESFSLLSFVILAALATNPDWVERLRCDRISVILDRNEDLS